MVFILPLIPNCFNPLSKHLETVSRAPTTTGITNTFMFHRFFSFRSKIQVFVFSLSFIFTVVHWNGKINYCYYHYFLCGFFTPVITGNFFQRPSDSKSLQISRTRLSIFANLSCAVVWIVSILLRFQFSQFSFLSSWRLF